MAHVTCKMCLDGKHDDCSLDGVCYCNQLKHPANILEILAKDI